MQMYVFFTLITMSLSAQTQVRSIKYYETILAPALCGKDDYFTKCFTLKTSCEFEMKKFAKTCARANSQNVNLEQPRKVASETQRSSLDINVGFCMGQTFEKTFYSDKHDSPECYSRKKWQ